MVRLHRRLRWLWQVLLQQRLEDDNDQEGEREHQQQALLHSGFVLGILKVCQMILAVLIVSIRASQMILSGKLHRECSALGRSLRMRKGGNAAAAKGLSHLRAALRAGLPLPSRTPSKSAGSGRPAATGARRAT